MLPPPASAIRPVFTREQLATVCKQFQLPGAFADGSLYGSGPISDTFLITLAEPERFILQRINQNIFPHVPALLDYIQRVTRHAAHKLGQATAPADHNRVLTLGPTRDGRLFLCDAAGECWRIYDFIQGALLQEPALERAAMADRLLGLHAAGRIPERIMHNDTKLNNVMLEDATDRAVCVIDLDTLMPGLALYGFGNRVRTATHSAAEDETELAKIHARGRIFEALVEGYLEAAGRFLLPAEVDELVLASRLLTFENGIRFLTDYLQSDTYYKIARPSHNLDRTRAQFTLLRCMKAQAIEMASRVRRYR